MSGARERNSSPDPTNKPQERGRIFLEYANEQFNSSTGAWRDALTTRRRPSANDRLAEIEAIARATDSFTRSWGRIKTLAALQSAQPFTAIVYPSSIPGAALLAHKLDQAAIRWRVLGYGMSFMDTQSPESDVALSLRVLRERPAFFEDCVSVPAGYNLAPIVDRAAERGLSGLECFAGFGGTTGGFLQMDSGSGNPALWNLVEHVTIAWQGQVWSVNRTHQLYKSLTSPGTLPEKFDNLLILAATLQLRAEAPEKVQRETERWRRARLAAQRARAEQRDYAGENAGEEYPALAI